jgi:hypothetical protein
MNGLVLEIIARALLALAEIRRFELHALVRDRLKNVRNTIDPSPLLVV